MPLHDVAAFRQGDPLAGLVDGGDVFVQSPLTDPEAIWASIPARRAGRDARAPHPGRRARHGRPRPPARAPRPDLVLRMQGVALVGVFLRLAPFAARARPRSRRSCSRAVRDRLGRFFGKRGGAVVDANLAVIAEAYDG